jgi:hypothetical protein
MQGERNLHTLLVRMYASGAYSMEALYKAKYRPFIRFINTTPGIYPKECNSSYYKKPCISMFIAALLRIFRVLK